MKENMRKLGRSGIEVSSLGFGCWAIGGPLWYIVDDERHPLSYGNVNDKESIEAIHRALELGVNFFDTADAYGCGHSERVLGQAIEGRREEVIIATKFGNVFDEESRTWLGHPDPPISAKYVRECCKASLERLNTDYIDLYQFHWKDYNTDLVTDLLSVLENLVDDGMILSYGWSTPNLEQARAFVEGQNCTAIQYNYNILERHPEMLTMCKENNQASITRGPLAMGLLTGKYTRNSSIPKNDLRVHWNLREGRHAKQLEQLDLIQEVLTRDGRTLVQAAMGWLWALDPQIIPIPGFKTIKQVEETAGALEFGSLSQKQMQEIDKILEPYKDELIVLD